MPKRAFEKRKTRAGQVSATREQAVADAEVCAPQKNQKTGVTFSRLAALVPSYCAWSPSSLLVFINKISCLSSKDKGTKLWTLK
jgi:hypothetical protein